MTSETRKWKLPFLFIWGGQAVSLVGSALVQFALIWWLTIETGSPTTLAMATAVGLIPPVVLGPFAGALVDRWPRKWVLVISDSSIAIFTALLGVLFWFGLARPWHVYAIMFLRSLGDAFQNPAMLATTPLMVPKEQLTRVSGLNRTLMGIVQFVAPALGAVFLQLIDVQGVLFIDIGTACLAILPLLLILIPQPKPTQDAAHGIKAVMHDFRAGLRYAWNHRGIRYMLITASIWSLIVFPPWVAFLPLLVSQHFGKGAMEFGMLQSAAGGCMIAGGIVLTAWGGFKRRIFTSVTGTLGMGVGFIITAMATADMFWLAVAGWSVAGFALSIHGGPIDAIYQAVVPTTMQGRLFAIQESIWRAIAPLSLAIAGPLAEIIGVRPFYFILGFGALAIASIRLLMPSIRNIEGQADERTQDRRIEPKD